MKEEDLMNIVGKVEKGKPATMRYFNPVNEYNSYVFNSEFLWLEEYVKPSEIIVRINCVGGSVVPGISTYDILSSSKIPVTTINVGIAASMGSILWSAGHNRKMMDYAILMAHNPTYGIDEADMSPTQKAQISAFKEQIATIYRNRWSMDEQTVQQIMDGKDDVDGTYFNAKDAVKSKIILSGDVIKTTMKEKAKIKAELDKASGYDEYYSIFNSLLIKNESVNDLNEENSSIIESTDNPALETPKNTQQEVKNDLNVNDKKMEKEFNVIASMLGVEGGDFSKVSAEVTALMSAKNENAILSKAKSELEIKNAGLEQSVKNTQTELEAAKAKIASYEEKEKAELEAELEKVVDEAIAVGKITAEAREKWMKMGRNDLSLVKDTLAGIAEAKSISEQIDNDPLNVENKMDGKTPSEKDLEQKIRATIGEDFKWSDPSAL